MRRCTLSLAAAVLLAGGAGGVGACTGVDDRATDRRSAVEEASTAPTTAAPPLTAPSPVPLAGRAPEQPYPVSVRTLALARGPDRPLPTTIYHPATGRAGRFPVVVFSHGLTGRPAGHQALLTRWAAAGFVVVAPAYPHTSAGVPRFDILDVVNQPADASHVLSAVLALDGTAGDPLRGRLDTAHVGAAGHSAGGITTVGLFTRQRDPRLRAGVVLAGNDAEVGDVYSGLPASLLFVHGGQDPIVSYASGKAAYDKVPWAKALFTLPREGHGNPYLRVSDPAYTAVAAVTTDFLRWTLYGDAAARARLSGEAGRVGTLDDHL